MTIPHNVVHLDLQRGGREEGVKLPAVVLKLRDKCARHLQKLLNRMFDQIDDTLFGKAERSENGSEQTLFFDAMRELRLKQGQVVGLCVQGLTEDFRFLPAGGRRRAEVLFDAESLSLVQNDVLEEQVAFDNMIKRSRAATQRDLEHLTLRLAAVISGVRVEDDNNPLSPDRLVAHFGRACSCIEIDIKPRLVLYKLFEKQVLVHLKSIYEAANKYLIEQGVMPDLRSVTPASRQAGRRQPIYQQGQVIDSATGAIQETTREDTLEVLRQLLGTQHSGLYGGQPGVGMARPAGGLEMVAGQGMATGQGLPQQALVGLLSTLQQRPQQAQGAAAALNYRALVEAALESSRDTQKPQLGPLDQDIMNLVSMLFEYILSDRNLHPKVKALIGRLQIPVLKVAILDRTFFSKANHSARRLLNELASSAIGWTESEDGVQDPFLSKLEAIVDVLIREFDADITVFDTLLEDFLAFVEADRKRRRLVEQRTRDAELGRAKSDVARRLVQDELNGLLDGAAVPALTLSVLHQGWSGYLVLLYLKGGKDTAEWRAGLDVARRLIAGTALEETREPLEVAAIGQLLSELGAGLQQSAFQTFEQERLLRKIDCLLMETSQARIARSIELEDDFLNLAEGRDGEALVSHSQVIGTGETPVADTIQEPAGGQTVAATAAAPVAAENAAALLQPEDRAPVHAEIQLVAPEMDALSVDEQTEGRAAEDLLAALGVGCWVEIRESEERRYRAKLAAIIQTTGKYVFVNRMGVKVAEKSRMTLALALKRNEIVVLDDSCLFDRALETLIGNLRSSRPGSSAGA